MFLIRYLELLCDMGNGKRDWLVLLENLLKGFRSFHTQNRDCPHQPTNYVFLFPPHAQSPEFQAASYPFGNFLCFFPMVFWLFLLIRCYLLGKSEGDRETYLSGVSCPGSIAPCGWPWAFLLVTSGTHCTTTKAIYYPVGSETELKQ